MSERDWADEKADQVNVGIRHEGSHFTRDPYGVYMLECRTEHGAESYIFAHESEMEVV